MLAPDSEIGVIGIFRVLGEKTLIVTDKGYGKTIDLSKSGKDLRTIVGAVFHKLAVVDETRENLFGIILTLLINGENVIEVLGRKLWRCRSSNPEHGWVISRHHPHVFLDAIQYPPLSVMDFAEVRSLIKMCFYPAGTLFREVFGGCDQRLCRFRIVKEVFPNFSTFEVSSAISP